MFDFAQVQMMGRATSDAYFYNLDNEERTSRAIFTIACNLSFSGKGRQSEVRSIFRRIVVLGSFANYLYKCQEADPEGLKGRLIILTGVMDNEINRDIELDNDEQQEIILVSRSSHGCIKVIDRRNATD